MFAIPGVVGIAVGPKIVGGELTAIPAIHVYVTRKRALAELAPDEIIPAAIEDVATDVLEGVVPVEMSATVRCRSGKITDVVAGPGGEIKSPGHGLTDGTVVRLFGVSTDKSWAVPITVKDADVFTVPTELELHAGSVADFAFWAEVSTFEHGICCCRSGPITDTASGNPVTITSAGHGLASGDRIKIAKIGVMHEIKGKEFIVGNPKKDTFQLRGIDGSTFTTPGVGMESGEWEKLCIDRSGRIQRVKTGASVVFTSHGHALKANDRIHIITTLVGPSDPRISSWDRPDPYTVASVTGDTFTVKELRDVTPAIDSEIVGCWIRIFPDGQMYSRVRGGIRVAMSRDEVKHSKPLINTTSSALTHSSGGGTVQVTTHITYGTLGCIAVENGTNTRVLLSNYHVLWSVSDEDNVHHPDYKSCKSHKIGERMRYAKPGTIPQPGKADAGIAKLTRNCDPVIVDIGDVKGTATITLAEIVEAAGSHTRGYRVRKRGVTTLVTEGVVIALDAVFNTPDSGVALHLNDQIIISPMAGDGLGAFSLKGDSGSALVNDDNKVVGLVCGGDHLGRGYASPIAAVESLLNIKVLETPASTPITGGGSTPEDELVIVPRIPELLVSVMSEVSASEAGAHFVSLAMAHHQEVAQLVHHNRRVMVAWHRNGGPAFLYELQQFVIRRDVFLPAQVEGRSVHQCAESFFDALKQCGSAKLASDIERHRDDFLQLSSLTYAGMLDMLAARGEAPRG